ncbi:MAG TPA: hypothetical protein VGM62_11040 [Chthoniobacterales bacterium]
MRRSAVHAGLIVSFVFALALSVSPSLHERFHPDAKQAQHECAVTIVANGNYHHAASPLVIAVPVPAMELATLTIPSSVWVPSPFLEASVFEHGPPACA